MPTTLSTSLEGFGYKIRRDEDGAARTTMEVRCVNGGAEIVFVCHVADRIVYEHSIELASQAQSKSPHVSFVVLALGIEPATVRQHSRRQVDERHSKLALQKRSVVAAATSQFEECA